MSTLEDRFCTKFVVDHETGCWPWQAALTWDGYGRILGNPGQRLLSAHRVAYELAVEPIPEGLTLDHLCRNRACVNPDHLEPVTLQENAHRGEKAQRTHCIRGHEFTAENTYIDALNRRVCRACHREWARHRRSKQRAAA